MSAVQKRTVKNPQTYYNHTNDQYKKVNLNDLVDRMNLEKKAERKNNILLSAVAVSAAIGVGVILTL